MQMGTEMKRLRGRTKIASQGGVEEMTERREKRRDMLGGEMEGNMDMLTQER